MGGSGSSYSTSDTFPANASGRGKGWPKDLGFYVHVGGSSWLLLGSWDHMGSESVEENSFSVCFFNSVTLSKNNLLKNSKYVNEWSRNA